MELAVTCYVTLKNHHEYCRVVEQRISVLDMLLCHVSMSFGLCNASTSGRATLAEFCQKGLLPIA